MYILFLTTVTLNSEWYRTSGIERPWTLGPEIRIRLRYSISLSLSLSRVGNSERAVGWLVRMLVASLVIPSFSDRQTDTFLVHCNLLFAAADLRAEERRES